MVTRKRIAIAGSAGAGILTVLGLADVPDQIAKWTDWLSFLGDETGRWVVVLVGFGIIVLANTPLLLERVAHLRVASPAPAPAAAPPPQSEARPARQPQRGASPREGLVLQGLTNRLAKVTAARVQEQVGIFRNAFDTYVETFLERRAPQLIEADLAKVRAEYRQLQRRVVNAYRPLREHYKRFIGDEPAYDRRHELYDPPVARLRLDAPLTKWWEPLTFDEAVHTWANADDAHLRHYLDRERAVLDAFADWIAEPQHHEVTREGVVEGIVRGASLASEPQKAPAVAERPAATVAARQGSIHGGAPMDTYTFELMNTGPGAVRDPRVWAANAEGERVSGEAEVHTLPPDMRWYAVRLEILQVMSRAGGLHLVGAWHDDSGPREEVLLEIKKL